MLQLGSFKVPAAQSAALWVRGTNQLWSEARKQGRKLYAFLMNFLTNFLTNVLTNFLIKDCCNWDVLRFRQPKVWLFRWEAQTIFEGISKKADFIFQAAVVSSQLHKLAIFLLLHLECFKVHIFWEGHEILWNLHLTFVYSTYRQK